MGTRSRLTGFYFNYKFRFCLNHFFLLGLCEIGHGDCKLVICILHLCSNCIIEISRYTRHMAQCHRHMRQVRCPPLGNFHRREEDALRSYTAHVSISKTCTHIYVQEPMSLFNFLLTEFHWNSFDGVYFYMIAMLAM